MWAYVCLLRAAKVFSRRHSSIKMHHPAWLSRINPWKILSVASICNICLKKISFKFYFTISRKNSPANIKLFKYLYECARSSSRLRPFYIDIAEMTFLWMSAHTYTLTRSRSHTYAHTMWETNWNFKQTHGRNKTQRPLYAGWLPSELA